MTAVSSVTEVTEVSAPLVADHFAINSFQFTDLHSQLTVYFEKAGITNEDVLSFMSFVQS